MIKIPLYSISGEKKKDITIQGDYKMNSPLIAQVLYVENNNLIKAGKAKTRAEVSGGGKKPWKQKGTGRARAGSIRSPLFRGGGITFGPNRVKKILKINRKMKLLALTQALSEKSRSLDMLAIEGLKLVDSKTKTANALLGKLNLGRKSYLFFDGSEKDQITPWNNLPTVEAKGLNNLKLSDLISNSKYVFTEKAVKTLSDKLECLK